MKLPSKQITVFANKVMRRKKTQSIRPINPRRDWFVGLGIGLLLLAGVVFWSGSTYLASRSIAEQSSDDVAVSVPMYRAATVAEALDYFSQRNDNFTQLLDVQVPVAQEVDPAANPAENGDDESSQAITDDQSSSTSTDADTEDEGQPEPNEDIDDTLEAELSL